VGQSTAEVAPLRWTPRLVEISLEPRLCHRAVALERAMANATAEVGKPIPNLTASLCCTAVSTHFVNKNSRDRRCMLASPLL
jgi:hypothetical protein